MSAFNQARFDELMDTLKALRRKHAEEEAAIQKQITVLLFPDEA